MVSFIIVNFNTAEITKNCVLSLIANTAAADREIIIVDNASSDDSPALLAAAFGDAIKIIGNSSNLGFAAANNIGARAATGDILFFLNSDTIIRSNIIGPIKAAWDDNQKLGIMAPTLLLADGQPQSFAFGRFPDLMSVIVRKMFPPHRFKTAGGLKLVDWVSGAALVIKKEIFKAVGGWDDKYFLYFEDVDLCWRTKQLGYLVGVYPQVEITHLGGRSLASQNWLRKKQYYLSQAYFFRKNYGRLSAFILRILRFPYKIWVWFNN